MFTMSICLHSNDIKVVQAITMYAKTIPICKPIGIMDTDKIIQKYTATYQHEKCHWDGNNQPRWCFESYVHACICVTVYVRACACLGMDEHYFFIIYLINVAYFR